MKRQRYLGIVERPFYKEKMMEEMIRRDVFEVVDLHETDDSNYWLDRSPMERIEAIEFIMTCCLHRHWI